VVPSESKAGRKQLAVNDSCWLCEDACERAARSYTTVLANPAGWGYDGLEHLREIANALS